MIFLLLIATADARYADALGNADLLRNTVRRGDECPGDGSSMFCSTQEQKELEDFARMKMEELDNAAKDVAKYYTRAKDLAMEVQKELESLAMLKMEELDKLAQDVAMDYMQKKARAMEFKTEIQNLAMLKMKEHSLEVSFNLILTIFVQRS